ncbi:MAG: DUF1902 domain-containing protein [Burkholderiaceae bacterium]
MYRIGLPGWKLAARWGWPLKLRVRISRDDATGIYVAESPDLDGLIVEAPSLDELRKEALGAAEVLLELALHVDHPPKAWTEFRLIDGAPCAA